MKPAIALLTAFFTVPSYGAGCDGMIDPDQMYNRFFQIAFDVDTIDGKAAYVTRMPSVKEASEGWACIEKATLLGNCAAIRIQELYYRHGVAEREFGISKNIEKADYYLSLKHEHCGTK